MLFIYANVPGKIVLKPAAGKDFKDFFHCFPAIVPEAAPAPRKSPFCPFIPQIRPGSVNSVILKFRTLWATQSA